MALNYKGVPYKTEWVEFPDIERLCKKIGVSPTGKKQDGTDYYSVPFITDSKTGAVVSHSWKIALYLEETYPAPEFKALFPPNSHAMQHAFNETYGDRLNLTLIKLIVAQQVRLLNPSSEAYYGEKVIKLLGPLDEIAPEGPKREALWATISQDLQPLAAAFDRNGKDSVFALGDTFSYADIILAAWFLWDKLLLPAKEWERLQGLNDGRWGRLMKEFETYEIVV